MREKIDNHTWISQAGDLWMVALFTAFTFCTKVEEEEISRKLMADKNFCGSCTCGMIVEVSLCLSNALVKNSQTI